MMSRAFKLRVRRRVRMQRQQVHELGSQAEEHLERNLFRRLERLRSVRRFVVSWLMLLLLLGGCVVVQMRALGGYYQTLRPVAGGTINEGIVGSFTNANPVYATSSVDLAVSRLLFSGLYTYDDHNNLVGNLAVGPWAMNADGTVYTVTLREDIKWHDRKQLTADDVVYTYQVIQNPDAKSPLNVSWQGIKVVALDKRTVQFTLPNPLGSFPHSLTNGIVPQHILKNVPMTSMRSAAFNTAGPIGTGPFQWQAIEVVGSSPKDRQERIALQRFDDYFAGSVGLSSFVLHSFRNQQDMIQSFADKRINAMAGLSEVPAELKNDTNVRQHSLPLTAGVMTFFKTTEGLLADANIRRALISAADRSAVIDGLGYPTKPVRQPFLQGQLGYDPTSVQPGRNLTEAKAILDANGWVPGAGGIRYKNKQPLTFTLYAEKTSEYIKVAKLLQKQWREVGVDVRLELQDIADFQSTLAFHSYDALLYGISIGNDPDVYAYWSSAQADMRASSRLNFAEWQSLVADQALEAGRTRTDPALRSVKYKPFLQAWYKDAPALGLYQPRSLYITRGDVFGLHEHYINTAADRFNNVHLWKIRQAAVSQAELE